MHTMVIDAFDTEQSFSQSVGCSVSQHVNPLALLRTAVHHENEHCRFWRSAFWGQKPMTGVAVAEMYTGRH